ERDLGRIRRRRALRDRERPRSDGLASVAAREGEAILRVADLVERGGVRARDEARRRAEREQREREPRERRDGRVLDRRLREPMRRESRAGGGIDLRALAADAGPVGARDARGDDELPVLAE